MHAKCPDCGLPLDPEPGYYLGAMYINYGLTVVVALGVAYGPASDVPMDTLIWPLTAFCVLFPIALFRHSRSMWRALDYYFSSIGEDSSTQS